MNSQKCNRVVEDSQLLRTKGASWRFCFEEGIEIKHPSEGQHSLDIKMGEPDRSKTRTVDSIHRSIRKVMKTFIVFALLTLVLPIQAQENVGYVMSIDGDWYLGGSKQPIKRWQKLPSRSKITPKKPITKSIYITVALLDGNTIHRTCSGNRGCKRAITLPKRVPAKPPSTRPTPAVRAKPKLSLRERISNAFWSIFEHPETYFVPTFARSGPPTDFQEAVLAWNSGQVNLSPVFKNMNSGTYTLAAEPPAVKGQQISPSDSIRIVIDWDPDQPTSATTNKLKPGLYRLIGERNYEAWVLITTPEKYDATHDSFRKAVKTTKEWGETVDPADARMFLRAYLESLESAE